MNQRNLIGVHPRKQTLTEIILKLQHHTVIESVFQIYRTFKWNSIALYNYGKMEEMSKQEAEVNFSSPVEEAKYWREKVKMNNNFSF